MRKNKLVATALLLSMGVSVLAGCTVQDFDPTVFMAQQNKDADQADDTANNTENETQTDEAQGKSNGLANITVVKAVDFQQDIMAISGLSDIANISVQDGMTGTQVDEKTSAANDTAATLLTFAANVTATLSSESADGMVIIAASDQLEELAYLISLTSKSHKPVVFMSTEMVLETSGMQTEIYNAVVVAADTASIERGVLITAAGKIYDMSTAKSEIGAVAEGKAAYREAVTQKNSDQDKFDVTSMRELPQVAILYDTMSMDTVLLEKAFSSYEGIVIAAAGNGAFSENVAEFIEESRRMPVIVRASRLESGKVVRNSGFDDDANHTIAAGTLTATKARILLMLSLGAKEDNAAIQQRFDDMP